MQKKIRTIIIDDEEEGRYILKSMLSKFPEIEIIAFSGEYSGESAPVNPEQSAPVCKEQWRGKNSYFSN